MKKNKNVVVVEKDVQIAKGVFLSEGDALIKTRNGWTLVEAEDNEDEKEVEESDDEEFDDDESDDDEEKVDEKKKK
jgi:hypothetical protein